MTSRTKRISSGSTEYSLLKWYPRRATFSVRIDLFSVSTVTEYDIKLAISNGNNELASCVSSNAKIIAISGARIVPPITAAMLISGQNPAPSAGKNIASSPPSAPPIISNGASTPPDVPDPSDTAQINHFTSSTPKITCVVTDPCSKLPIVSYPTPNACGNTKPPKPIANPPIAGHHIQ